MVAPKVVVVAAATGRDPAATEHVLRSWLQERLGGVSVAVGDLAIPAAGFSNETILGEARWRDAEGADHRRPFVLRVGATSHQLYPDNEVLRQAEVMRALAGLVPVPAVWLHEADPAVLGAPFFLMDRVDGWVPPDLPSWHKRGWVLDLAPADRGRLYDNGLAAMAALHALDWRAVAPFLEPAGEGPALRQYVDSVERWHEWCLPSIDVGADVIAAALAFVVDRGPDDAAEAISWGDARVGNIIYADDLSVAALVDWEQTTIAPPGLDLGWWLMFEHYLSEAQGVQPLDGVPGRAGTIERYEELHGRAIPDVDYYEVLAGLVFALINSRLLALLITAGPADRRAAEVVIGRVVDHIADGMDRA
jgi:aminoglycoside phosphotransferase (APT) family kinase protein